MTETALSELQNQIEAMRCAAFDEGYAAAMRTVHELASRSVPQRADNTAAVIGNGRGENETSQPEPNRKAIPLRTGITVRRAPAKRSTARTAATGTRRSQRGRAKRGTNALRVEQILKNARRAVRQADIRNALKEKGVSLSFPSIRHALGQLEARRTAKQIGKNKTWRYSAAA